MTTLEQLHEWDFPDTEWIPDGYNMKEIPKMSDRNFRILIDKVNEIIDYLENEDETTTR